MAELVALVAAAVALLDELVALVEAADALLAAEVALVAAFEAEVAASVAEFSASRVSSVMVFNVTPPVASPAPPFPRKIAII